MKNAPLASEDGRRARGRNEERRRVIQRDSRGKFSWHDPPSLPPSPLHERSIASQRSGADGVEREDDAYHDARAAAADGAWRIFFESITRLNEEGREDQAAVVRTQR